MERCFDLSRSITLHQLSTAATREKAVAGVTAGLIGAGQTVTWQATHLGVRQHLTSQITAFDRPYYFRDEQLRGAFKKMEHDHYFLQRKNDVLMADYFYFESPLGWLGRLFNTVYLTSYMQHFLQTRNQIIKDYAETHRWKEILEPAATDGPVIATG
ncbi:SRPBCC family protein [Niabella terrae]